MPNDLTLGVDLQHGSTSGTIELLGSEHRHFLVQAIRNVLSTEIAELTFAELIDGLPLASTGRNVRGNLIINSHPLNQHKALCAGSIDQIKEFSRTFNATSLRFDSAVLHAYQDSVIDTREFKMRLVELISRTVHQLGVFFFNLQPKLHTGDIDAVVSWKQEPHWEISYSGMRKFRGPFHEPEPTIFFHIEYLDFDQYPNGLADVAGYWAEDRIFGGVVVFDRGPSGRACNDLYFHPGRRGTTSLIWRLLESQFNEFIEFLTLKEPPETTPLPITASDLNDHRHDPWYAIAEYQVFRDPWERKFPPERPPDTRCTVSAGEYPIGPRRVPKADPADSTGKETQPSKT